MGTITAPAKNRAKSTSVQSYVVRAMKPTLSPGSIPAAARPFASATTWEWNSAAVMSRHPSPSGTANSASCGVAFTRSTRRSVMLACGSAGTMAGTSN
jgi:hypothetical protein